jgi:hypothetical protein
MSDLTILIIWFVSAVVGGFIIWLRQGRYLADVQPMAFLMCGPITLAIALLAPTSALTSKEKSEGKSNG